MKLSDHIYKCECGNVVDKDDQDALNLKRYGENVKKQSVAWLLPQACLWE